MANTPTPGTARWLTANGHPGYSDKFAAQVLRNMEAYGLSFHEAIYGGRSALRTIALHKREV